MSTGAGPAGGVFLSYSRRDSWFVLLYRVALRNAGVKVWHDQDSIEAGQKWRGAIAMGVHDCGRMFVFWCRHASRSKEVEREYTMALDQQKIIVPIVMDRTALPAALAQFHYEDLRWFTWWSHDLVKIGVIGVSFGAVCVGIGWWLGGRL